MTARLETILEKAAELGATYSAYTILRLPLEVSPLFQEWLEAFAPDRAKRIMRHIREMNGGRDYDPHWSRGGEVKGIYAQLMMKRYEQGAPAHRTEQRPGQVAAGYQTVPCPGKTVRANVISSARPGCMATEKQERLLSAPLCR